jgi:hypothetical protein
MIKTGSQLRFTFASALASGDTQAVIDLLSRMGAGAAAQSNEEEEALALPYKQAVSQR